MTPSFAGPELPIALRSLADDRRWVVWRWEQAKGGGQTKVPYQAARPAARASSTSEHTWGRHTDATASVAAGRADGIGYVLTDSNLSAFDLDHCLDADSHEIQPWARELVEKAGSYVEITPSGQGLRIIGTASKTAGRVHRNLNSLGTPGSVYRRAERYITITGHEFSGSSDELADLDAVVDEAVIRLDGSPQAARQDLPPLPASISYPGTGAPFSDRLPAELESIIADGVETGDRSDQFHHAVGWLKDLGLSAGAVEAELRRFPSGIAAKYLRPRDRLAREVARCWPRLEQKAPRSTVGRLDDGTLYDLGTGEVVTPSAAKLVASPLDQAAELLVSPCLIGRIARWILTCSRRPQPKLAIAAAISLVGTLASRQLHTPTRSYLNTFMLITAPTGMGKDAPMRAVRSILAAANLRPMIGPEGFASDVGLLDHVNRAPVSVMAIDEFGELLSAITGKNAPPHLAKVSATLRLLWDARLHTTSHAITRRSVTLYDPCLSLFCGSTPGQFFEAIGHAQIENGFINRFMLVHAPGQVERNREAGDISAVPPDLVAAVQAIADRPGGLNPSRFWIGPAEDALVERPYVVPWASDAARAAWEAYEDESVERSESNKHLEAFGARTAHNAIKLATILAVAADTADPRVDERHVEIARALVEASLNDMLEGHADHVPTTAEASLADRIVERIRRAGGSMSKRDLYRSTRRAFRAFSEFETLMRTLEQSGDVGSEECTPAKGGPKRVTYHAIG